jgi:short-subunit dehydrogenase
MGRQELVGKRVWLTGAGAGIGRALALRLAQAGCRLGLTARTVHSLESLRDEIVKSGHEKPLVLAADVTDPEALSHAHARFARTIGSVQMLIANAGIYNPEAAFDFCASEVMRVMEVNYGGLVRCVELVLPEMKLEQSGKIVGVSSLVAYRGLPRAAAYCASKAAMSSFLESVRFDVEGSGIAVQVVSPGFVKTRLTEKNDFPMPFRISAEQAAYCIEQGICSGRREIYFPLRFAWPMKLLRILPYPLYHTLVKRGVVQ